MYPFQQIVRKVWVNTVVCTHFYHSLSIYRLAYQTAPGTTSRQLRILSYFQQKKLQILFGGFKASNQIETELEEWFRNRPYLNTVKKELTKLANFRLEIEISLIFYFFSSHPYVSIRLQ